MQRLILGLSLTVAFCTIATLDAVAADPCPRPNSGAVVARPPDLHSQNGVLKVVFHYVTSVDGVGRTLFCFKTPDGLESPTLHVRPGDTLDVTVTNDVPALPPGSPTEIVSDASNVCGDKTMTGTSVNMHFHGTNTSPKCHGDQVIHTIINSGQTFHYALQFPNDEPPGLYWYHPHVHGIADGAVLGGASGAIVVEGIQHLQPAVAGLRERILVIRDQNVGAAPVVGQQVPAWDVSLNYVPIAYPAYAPAILHTKPGRQELWRVVNAASDTIMDLQLRFDGIAQPLQIVGLDGVPTGSQDGSRRGHIVTVTHILIPPAGRAEFIVNTPPASVGTAVLVTQYVNTGPGGDYDPERPLALLQETSEADDTSVISSNTGSPWPQRFEGLDRERVSANRKLYFSEVLSDPTNPASPTNFFLTVDGATPVLFDPANPPAITTTQGSTEDWTIENRSGEHHEFHMHQIHFKLLKQNGLPVPADQRQFLDMIQVPFWSGTGPYPSVTVRMDFRGPDIGDFVYHCHILGHEDNGMMATIRVLPKS